VLLVPLMLVYPPSRVLESGSLHLVASRASLDLARSGLLAQAARADGHSNSTSNVLERKVRHAVFITR
jgi:hypothetical protein